MADESQAPEPEEVQDTPTPEARTPEEGTPEVNWQERYEHLQPEYTRATQRLSELEPVTEWLEALNDDQTRDEAIQQLAEEIGPEAVLDALGFEAERDPDEPEPDPAEEMRTEWEQFKAMQAQQYEQAQIEQAAEHLRAEIQDQAKELNLSDDELEWIYLRSLARPGSDDEIDVAGAIEDFQSMIDGRAKKGLNQWAASKRSSTPVQGREGIQTLSPDAPHADRVAAMTEQLLANSQ